MGATKPQKIESKDLAPGGKKGEKKGAKAKPKKAKAKVKKPKTVRRNIGKAKVYINSTFNNTLVTVTDLKGEVVAWSTGGVVGNKGSRKSTPFAGAQATRDAIEKAKRYGVTEVEVYVKGPGAGKETSVKAVATSGVRVLTIKDTTSFPHNGCRPKKRRR